MQSVRVSKVELLDKVNSNLEKHRALFLKAQEGYRAQVIKELDHMLKDAREGKPIRRAITLPEPIDHTKDYERVISMLKMSIENTIELSAMEFEQYVLDQWDWTALAMMTNTRYA